MGQTLRFIHQHSQGQGFRPHLHRRRPDRIGGLQQVAPLYPFAALRTTADRYIKPPYPRAAHDLFLILWLDPLYRQCPAALRAFVGNRHGDLFVYAIRNGPTAVLAVLFPRLASWRLPWILSLPSRERRRLTLRSTLRRFQLLLQARVFFLQSYVLVLQTLLLPLCPIKLFLGLAQLPHQLPDPGNWVQGLEIEKQMTL